MKQIDQTQPNHILIGLGGTGGKVLKAFRKRLWEEFPKSEDRRKLSIGFVYVDSTDEMMKPGDPSWKVFGQSAQFEDSEFVNIKTTDLGMILNNPDAFPGLKNIVKNGEMMRKTLGEVGAAAGQKRRAGRILFASNISKYLAAVKTQYEKVTSCSGNKASCHIHIFTGLAGGTGSGSIIDAVAQLRADASFKGESTEITVYAMVPELDIPAGCQAGRYHQNGYAALCELSALNIGQYLPCDVKTGEEHVRLDTISNRQFGLVVYSNVNENGATANSFRELPKLLSDTVYYSIFMRLINGVTDDFIRGLSCENIPDFCVEYSTNSKGDDKERARTKAISSFGIKRIVYPEQRVVEHISYTLADSIFNQMAYNNYKDDLGFTKDPQKKDYEQNYIKDDSQRRKWMLDDSFLTLDERILDTDKKFEKIEDFWKSQSNFYSFDDAKNADSNPLHYVEQFCEDTYKKSFRIHKQGVEEYYADKSKDEVLKTQAEFILENIERDLYTQWYEGTLSLTDLLRVSDTILIFLKNRRNKIPGEIDALAEKAKGFQQELAGNMDEYTHLNLLQKATGRPKDCYTDHQAILTDLYTVKTQMVAMEFASRLLSKLQALFEAFHNEVQSFVGALALCMEEASKRISDRNQQQGSIKDMKQAVIEVREDTKVASFEKSLLLNRNRMESLAGTLRHELVGNKTYAHFDELTKGLTIEKAFEVVDHVMGQQVREIHEVECTKDKLIGINILQQLQKVLVTEDDIRAFTKDAVDKSGVFILLDDTQLQKTLNNNPNPVAQPESINRKTILVTLPSYEGDDSLKEFAKKLEYSFRSAFGNATPGSTINFNTSDGTKNEITIAAVKYCFPLRALKWMPEFEREYKMMTESSNPADAKEARILLHSEGDGTCLPPIMGEKVLSAQEFVPYFFLAAATGILNLADDDVNGRGWCLTREGDWGIKTNKFLSSKFTDLPTCEAMTSEYRNEIMEKVNDILKNAELPMSKRAEFEQQIGVIMRDYVVQECSSTNSPKFQQFSAEAKKAQEILKKK